MEMPHEEASGIEFSRSMTSFEFQIVESLIEIADEAMTQIDKAWIQALRAQAPCEDARA